MDLRLFPLCCWTTSAKTINLITTISICIHSETQFEENTYSLSRGLDMFPKYSADSILVGPPLNNVDITLLITEHKDNEHVLVASKCLSPFGAAVLTSNKLQNFQTTILYCWIKLHFFLHCRLESMFLLAAQHSPCYRYI